MPDFIQPILSSSSALQVQNGGYNPGAQSIAPQSDVSFFNQLINSSSAQKISPAGQSEFGAVTQFVGVAEQKYQAQTAHLKSSINSVQSIHDIKGLLVAQYQSANAAVGLQLASKVGTKSTESIESILRQQ